MKRRGLLVALAVVLALVGTLGVYAYARSADQRAVAKGKAVSVVVATKRIAVGTSWKQAVQDGALTVQHMPSSATPSQALAGLDAGVSEDAVAQSDISPGTPVLREVFGPPIAETGVLAIPKGDIAITVSMSADGDVALYPAPKSEVAIFVTAGLDTKDKSKAPTATTGTGSGGSNGALIVTRVVVPRATVLATSSASPTALVADGGSTSGTAGSSVLVTLALSQKDAERVINQEKVGTLTFGLLSADSQITQDGGYVNAGGFTHVGSIWAD